MKRIKGAGQDNEMPGSDILVGGESEHISTEELINEIENINSSDNSSSSVSDIEFIEDLNDSSSSSNEESDVSSFIASSSLLTEPGKSRTVTTILTDISSSSVTTSSNKYGAKNSQSGGCSVRIKSNINSNFKSDNFDNYIIRQKLYDTSDSIFSN